MDIVFCTDNNYAMPCGVAIVSLLENNRNNHVTIHIIGLELSEENKELLSSIVAPYNSSLLHYDIDLALLKKHNFSLRGSPYLSFSTYSRLFVIDILPTEVNKIIYLDCDLIVCGDLSVLWNTHIDNYSIAGVTDVRGISTKQCERLGFDESYSYINAGVLLLNLKYWREHNITDVLLNYAEKNYEKLVFHDQDVINGSLYDSKIILPLTYNMMDYYYRRESEFGKYKEEIRLALRQPTIIHFSSSEKPWRKIALHPLRKEFIKYKKLSPWKDTPLIWSEEPFSRRMRYYKRVILHKLKIKKLKYIDL